MTSDARDYAVQQLNVALLAWDALSQRPRPTSGRLSELAAKAQLQVAADEVVARRAALKETDDEGIGGRVWVNGREVGGEGSVFVGLEDSHD